MNEATWTPAKVAPFALFAALTLFGAISTNGAALTQKLFVSTTYYLLLGTVLCWAGTYLHVARDLKKAVVVEWVRENWTGLLIALAITGVAGLSIEPALRVLSDEANLVGVSKNLFASKTATFTVSGKYYYESYWNVDVAIDRRPTLFPFLVSLVHTVFGYDYRNAFLLNLLVLPVFVLLSYRLAKTLGGEAFGIAAALLVAAHPTTLISVRSAGFDFLAAFFSLLVVKSMLDFLQRRSAGTFAVLWLNLCLLTEVRYESALFMAPVLGVLVLFKLIDKSTLRPYAFVHALTPMYLLPRIWQSILRGNVPEQDAGTTTFGVENFLNNGREYFLPLLEPSKSYPAHSAVVISLGIVGCLFGLRLLFERGRASDWRSPQLRFGIFVIGWMVLQAVIVFTYYWGRAQYPSAARLVIAIDTFFSFAAAWVLAVAFGKRSALVPAVVAVGILTTQVPVASQHRMLNRLTQTRENASTWAFFERLEDKRILIVTDRPNHFTIMGYGAMSFEAANSDKFLFTALERRLFQDVYVIQQIQLSTGSPFPGYETWPARELEALFEFQNDADVLVKISRVVH